MLFLREHQTSEAALDAWAYGTVFTSRTSTVICVLRGGRQAGGGWVSWGRGGVMGDGGLRVTGRGRRGEAVEVRNRVKKVQDGHHQIRNCIRMESPLTISPLDTIGIQKQKSLHV